ncbi:MAG: hypothetical protein ACOYL6_17030 [Bacteriovoracaceae bacterium]
MKSIIMTLAIILSGQTFANNYEDIKVLKELIVKTAGKYQGLGDPDFKIQNELEPLVNKLLTLQPQTTVINRLPLIFGVWKQVWGPYEYRKNDRSVDPTLNPKEIYQVVSPEGFYYNVSPNLDPKGRKEKNINYLKGKYVLSKKDPNGLDVKFVKFIGMKTRPTEKAIYQYVEEAERNQLPTQITIVPKLIVKLFFGGGTLREIYTDEDLRILYGSNNKEFKNQYLYIMTRVNDFN